jgi:hypothetical protein
LLVCGIIVSKPTLKIIVFGNCTTLHDPMQGTNFFNNLTITNVWVKHFENFHDMLANNALCFKGVMA